MDLASLKLDAKHHDLKTADPSLGASNAIYLELHYLISLVCISRLPRLASSDDRCVSTRLPYSGLPVSRVLQHCAARYHREALP
jgi:hypothetical protein